MDYITYMEKTINSEKLRKVRTKMTLEHILYHLALKERVRLDAPTIVGLDVTSKCNLSCKHCFQNNRRLNNELTTEEWIGIIQELKDMKVYQVYIMGGEPFIRTDLMDIIEYIKKSKMTLSINTNATLITEQMADKLSEFLDSRFDYIQVSLDGATEEINDNIRGKGVFQIILDKILLLKKYGIKVRVNSVVNYNNYMQMTELYKICNDLGVDRIAYTTIYPYKRESLFDIPRDEDCISEFNRMLEYAERIGNPVLVEQDPICVPYRLKYFENYFQNNISKSPVLVCRAGLFSCEIDPIGDVYPCTFLHHSQFRAGNIRQQSFRKIWCEDKNWTTIADKISELNDICRKCQFMEKCKGGCIASGVDSGEGIGGGDPRCHMIQSEYSMGR